MVIHRFVWVCGYVRGLCLTWHMRISLDSLTAQVALLRGLDGVEPRSLTGDQAVEWLRASGEVVQSVNAIIAALTARVCELSTGEDRTKRFARVKGFSDVGSLVSEVAQVPRGDAGRLVTLGQAVSDADAGSLVPAHVGVVQTRPTPRLPLYAFLTQAVARGFSAEKAAIIRDVGVDEWGHGRDRAVARGARAEALGVAGAGDVPGRVRAGGSRRLPRAFAVAAQGALRQVLGLRRRHGRASTACSTPSTPFRCAPGSKTRSAMACATSATCTPASGSRRVSSPPMPSPSSRCIAWVARTAQVRADHRGDPRIREGGG